MTTAKAKTVPTVPTIIRDYVDKGVNAQRRYADQLFRQAKERVDELAKRVEGTDDQVYHLSQRMESAEEAGARIDAEMEGLRAFLATKTEPGPSDVKIESVVSKAPLDNDTGPEGGVACDESLLRRQCNFLNTAIMVLVRDFYHDTGLVLDSLHVQKLKTSWALKPLFVIPAKED